MRRRLLIVVAAMAAICLLAAGGGLLYLHVSDLTWMRGPVENALSRTLGREVAIDGGFRVRLRSTISLTAEEVHLANLEAGTEPFMVTIDRLHVEARLAPLFAGAVHIGKITIDGARILLEQPADGPPNWHFAGLDDAGAGADEPPEVSVQQLELRDLQLRVRSPSGEQPLELALAKLAANDDGSGIFDLDLRGVLNGGELGMSGRLGPLAGLLGTGGSECELAGTLAGAAVAVTARLDELAELERIALELDAEGDELSRISALFDPGAPGQGPFRLRASLTPLAQGSTLALDAELGELSARVEGVVDSLSEPEHLDLRVSAAGPDLRAATHIAGFDGAPAEPFSFDGRVSWAGFPIRFDAVEIRVGANTLSLDGVLGEPPSFGDSNFQVSGSGPDVSALGALAGLRLPAVPYRVAGRLIRVEGGVALDELSAQVGDTRVDARGRVGDPPERLGTELELQAAGPSLAHFSVLAGRELPDQAFAVDLKLSPEARGVRIARSSFHLGTTTARVAGLVVPNGAGTGSKLEVEIDGTDLSELQWIHGRDGLASHAFSARATLGLAPHRLVLQNSTLSVDTSTISLDGSIGLENGGAGTDLELSASGPETGAVATLTGLTQLPLVPYRLDGHLRLADGLLLSDRFEAQLGAVTLQLSGHLAVSEPLEGSQLELRCEGSHLSELSFLLGDTALPEVPFSVHSGVGTEGGRLRLSAGAITLAGNQLRFEGTVVPTDTLDGTDLELELFGPDLGALGALADGIVDLPELPAEPYSARGGVAFHPPGYELRSLHCTLGRAELSVQGTLATAEQFAGSDLSIELNGPDASLLTSLTGVTVPVAPFTATGRIVRGTEGFTFHDLRVGLGEYRAHLDGSLGPAPRFVGSDLRFAAGGPSLELVEQLSPLSDLPDLPFAISGVANGSPELFEIDELDLRLGDSDARGRILIALSDHPEIDAQLRSRVIDLASLAQPVAKPSEEPAQAPATAPSGSETRLIPDQPLALSWLARIDADVDWQVATLRTPTAEHVDVGVLLSLQDGHFVLGPVALVGARGGRLEGRLELIPEGDTWRLDARLDLDDGKSDFTAGTGPADAELTNVDVKAALKASGRTLHELASSLSGQVIVSLEGGRTSASILDHISADLLLTILEALNPVRAEGSKTVGLDCAVMVVEIRDGLAVLEPMALKSENLTILGRGAVDLSTEKLDFEWATKARKGLGLNVSSMTNPYVKLSGTLSQPTIAVKPISALASTSLALATGGLSVLGRGMWDRLMSERKVCEKCLEEASRRREGKKPRKRSLIFQ